jgi:hypothetical protein
MTFDRRSYLKVKSKSNWIFIGLFLIKCSVPVMKSIYIVIPWSFSLSNVLDFRRSNQSYRVFNGLCLINDACFDQCLWNFLGSQICHSSLPQDLWPWMDIKCQIKGMEFWLGSSSQRCTGNFMRWTSGHIQQTCN